jgi:hypothetical protein
MATALICKRQTTLPSCQSTAKRPSERIIPPRRMSMSSDPQRFDVPMAKRTLLEKYRAMRAYFERVAKSQGESLDPSWYEDGPDQMPQLYKDQKPSPE